MDMLPTCCETRNKREKVTACRYSFAYNCGRIEAACTAQYQHLHMQQEQTLVHTRLIHVELSCGIVILTTVSSPHGNTDVHANVGFNDNVAYVSVQANVIVQGNIIIKPTLSLRPTLSFEPTLSFKPTLSLTLRSHNLVVNFSLDYRSVFLHSHTVHAAGFSNKLKHPEI